MLSTFFVALFAVLIVTSGATTPHGEQEQAAHSQASVDIVNSIIEECDNSAHCVLKRFADYVRATQEQQTFEAKNREKLGLQLEAYACSDKTAVSSEPIRHDSWRDWNVKVMHERPASKIHLINGFVSEEECQNMLLDANERPVAPGTLSKGYNAGQRFRRVMQNDVEPANHAEVARRVYDYAKHVLEGLDISEQGQARFKYLRYTGRGRNETNPDHYSSHCKCETLQALA